MKTLKKKTCVCGKEFIQYNSLQKYCSAKCAPKINKLPKRTRLPKTYKQLKKSKKTEINKVDKLWADAVKKLAGNKCEYCGKTSPLNSHHIFSRSKKSTRWNINNGICLCVGHHTFSSSFSAHKTPAEFIEWIKEKRGEKWYAELRQKAHENFNEDLENLETIFKTYLLS